MNPSSTPPAAQPSGAPGWRADLFAGSAAFITGGGSGIGESTARMLAGHGCSVVVADRDLAAAHRVAGSVRSAGGAALAVAVDVVKAGEVDAAVKQGLAWAGRLDIVVNCAGVVLAGDLATLDLAGWQTSFDVNVLGPLLVARAAFAALCASDRAAIVTIASISGGRAYPRGGAYGPSKAALISLTRQLSMEWAQHGIRVNAVSPGSVLTPMMTAVLTPEARADRAGRIPMGRMAQPDEIASAIAFLASPMASYITGQELLVDGGMSQSLMRQSFNAQVVRQQE